MQGRLSPHPAGTAQVNPSRGREGGRTRRSRRAHLEAPESRSRPPRTGALIQRRQMTTAAREGRRIGEPTAWAEGSPPTPPAAGGLVQGLQAEIAADDLLHDLGGAAEAGRDSWHGLGAKSPSAPTATALRERAAEQLYASVLVIGWVPVAAAAVRHRPTPRTVLADGCFSVPLASAVSSHRQLLGQAAGEIGGEDDVVGGQVVNRGPAEREQRRVDAAAQHVEDVLHPR
jgi:hypothetical protein